MQVNPQRCTSRGHGGIKHSEGSSILVCCALDSLGRLGAASFYVELWCPRLRRIMRGTLAKDQQYRTVHMADIYLHSAHQHASLMGSLNRNRLPLNQASASLIGRDTHAPCLLQ